VSLGSILVGLGAAVVAVRQLGDAMRQLGDALAPSPRTEPVRTIRRAGLTTRVHEVRSIDDRIAHIADMIRRYSEDPRVMQAAARAVSERCGKRWCVKPRDHVGEIEAVFRFVKRHVRYVRDGVELDTYRSPLRTLEVNGGDCDDYTILLGALLRAIGFPVKLRIIRTRGAPDWNHIYLLVAADPKRGGDWMPLDASADHVLVHGRRVPVFPGWEAPPGMVASRMDRRV
jgi:transglutaminase-like putative cysteine protease